MSVTEPLLAPISQPGGLYPASPPRMKKSSKGSKLNKQKKGKFAKRPELPPISYHVTPYENPDNPPEYKRTGGRFWKVESEEGRFEMPFKNLPDKANRIYEHAYQSAKKRGLSDERAAKSGWGAVKNAGYVKKAGRWVKGVAQTPRQQKDTPSLQPREPLMRMTTPKGDADKEQRLHEYKSPFPGREYSPNFPERDPGETDTNPADLTLEELRQRERKAHPNLSDEEIDELVKMHIRELGPPSDEEHQEDYKRSHSKASRMLHFGVDTGIPISHRFRAVGLGDSGDIKLIGTFLDYETTTNGWHIDPEEESNIVDAPTDSQVTVRVAHSKEPERVIGKYVKFQANEDDGCTDAYGQPLGRHIDFEAVVNPQDPQLRTNILKGWVNDISPGLDAEVFCSECGEAWGLEQVTNKLLKTCEHQDAEGILRNIKPKEGSIVTEPAFEGRTQFHPTFTFGMAMNQLFSPESYESEPVGSRLKGHATDDGRQIKGGIKMTQNNMEGSDASKIATQLYNHGFFTASEAKRLQRLHFLKAEDEDEDEDKGEDEDEDEDARIRAAFPLIKKAMKRAAQYEKNLGDLFKKDEDEDTRMEDQHKYAEDRTEDEDEDEDRTEDEDEDEDRAEDSAPDQEGPIETPGDEKRDIHDLGPKNQPKVTYSPGNVKKLGPGQLGGMKAEDQARVLKAQRILQEEKNAQLLNEANVVLARQKKRKQMNDLQIARKIFEAQGNTDMVTACDASIAKLTAELAPKVDKAVTGAQAAPSTPVIAAAVRVPSQPITSAQLTSSFKAEVAPYILSLPRFQGLRFKEAPQ